VPNRLVFILSGARGGKSAYVESQAREYSGSVLFVATAQPIDDEMRERIARHRASRPAHWHTLEAPINVGHAIALALESEPYDTVVLDCITLLASNALLALPEDCTEQQADDALLPEIDSLLSVCAASTARWLVVSNEVGMGIVPPTPIGRLYRDALGRANQRIAAASDEVILMVAGLAWHLKS
jgi:adenosylcobinamide kinase / adenosylcobinamide-phosphate guanylyltransferase